MDGSDDRRLIEDYLPIQAISKEAAMEKSVRKGHISTLHLWWARRPLVAARAAVYGSLGPATQFVPPNGTEKKAKSLGRANAAKFVERLCKYPGDPKVIAEAERHILAAHAERLSRETGETVTVEDIEAGRAPRPKVLDMFAGGGSIPLEALRLGCEAYALDLNPVAHIIELCTLVYPQKYGRPDPSARGSAEDGTWAGLAAEVEHWGKWVLERVRAEIGDLYPPIPDPTAARTHQALGEAQLAMTGDGFESMGQQRLTTEVQAGWLTPVAYLWTRTVPCKNPSCGATVPLVKQTWLCKKSDRSVALKPVVPVGGRRVHFQVVEATTPQGLGKDGRTIRHRLRAQESAALASSIFLVARKREGAATGSYEDDVQPDLDRIVRERVETLWELGIVGADLVIAAVGAGLRAFTRFERVEFANGEEVPAERFLAEVEGVVLETLLEKIFDVPRSGVAAVDGPSRFYVLWRYTYKAAEMEAGEAIVFTYGQRVDLDGPRGLSAGSRALVEKKQGKYRLRDFSERGRDEPLGLPADDGTPAPLIDVLHRLLWLLEYEPRSVTRFLDEARPDRERLRLVAQALAGAGLRGKSEAEARTLVARTTSEQAALGKLTANWHALIESAARPLL